MQCLQILIYSYCFLLYSITDSFHKSYHDIPDAFQVWFDFILSTITFTFWSLEMSIIGETLCWPPNVKSVSLERAWAKSIDAVTKSENTSSDFYICVELYDRWWDQQCWLTMRVLTVGCKKVWITRKWHFQIRERKEWGAFDRHTWDDQVSVPIPVS